MKSLLLFFIALGYSLCSYAHIAVLHGKPDTVNYTQVLFEVPHHPNADNYEIVIEQNDGSKRPLITVNNSRNYCIVKSGLAYGNSYSWHYKYYDNKSAVFYTSSASILHINGTKLADSAQYRTNVSVNKSSEITDGYIALDIGMMINRQGQTVWTFPPDRFGAVRDLQLNNDGKLTFVWETRCYETDLKGNILWQSPDSIPGYQLTDYHHEFTKLKNGNFLCLATRKIPGEDDPVPFSVIFEITHNNEVQWTWDEKTAYAHDTNFRGSHTNAAYYDEQNKRLYLSMRDLNALACVNIETGKVDYGIGYKYGNGAGYYPQESFSAQHAVSLLKNGNLLFFNNNSLKGKTASSVVIMSQPGKKSPPSVIWEYTFNFSNARYNMVSKMGDVQELADGHLLICMGANSKVIEVNTNKEILWEADVTAYDTLSHRFNTIPSGYRGDFSTSLHPCYFVAHQQNDKLVIENVGTTTDRYVCSFIKNGKSVKTITTKYLSQYQQTSIPALKNDVADEVVITSDKNNSLSRYIKL